MKRILILISIVILMFSLFTACESNEQENIGPYDVGSSEAQNSEANSEGFDADGDGYFDIKLH